MKNINIIFCLALVIAGLSSCQKLMEGDKVVVDKLDNRSHNSVLLECAIPVSGQITTNTTWTTGNVYLLQGIVEVNGAKLTIQPGVVVLGEKSSKGGLVINRNAEIEAIGTECSPIIFTSDQSPGNRAPGDYFGVALLGNAPNNQSNSLTINIHGTNYTAGGNVANSSIGTFKYVQIHYAGSGSTLGTEPRAESALILGSLGSGSVIDHIQITNSARDGLSIWGGEPTVKYIFNYEVARTDFRMSYGTKANGQFLFGFKDQVTALDPAESFGMEISNYLLGTDADASPLTYPTISQLSLLGGNYCDGDTDFQEGIRIQNRGNARIYNSVISSFEDQGLMLFGDAVVANTGAVTDPLQFSYNTIHDISTNPGYSYNVSTTWFGAGGCALSALDDMEQWLDGSVPTCGQLSNEIQPSPFSLGYAGALCGDKCASSPSFNVTGSDLQEAEYDEFDLNPAIFASAPLTGALQPSGQYSWVQDCNWMSFCMQTQGFCL